MWLPKVVLGKGKFSDTGYRFRKNSFNLLEDWWRVTDNKWIEFYNINHYNSDTYDVQDNFEPIADMYFRLEVNSI